MNVPPEKTKHLAKKQELYQNIMCYFEQILEATSSKTAAVRPLTSSLTSQTNKMCLALLEK